MIMPKIEKKMSKKLKATILTMGMGIINSILLIILNFVYTRLILLHYGSEINGILSTVTQFSAFFSIFEGGVSTAVVVAAIEPLTKEDYDYLGDVLYTARKLFDAISVAVLIVGIPLGYIYSTQIKSPLSLMYTFILLLLSMINVSLSIGGLTRYSIILQADNKNYILAILSLISKAITWVFSIILVVLECNILFVFAINIFNVLLNILFNKMYEKKHYPNVCYKGKKRKIILRQTRDVFLQKIANTVFSYTDLIVVSLLIGMGAASAYNIYAMIYSAIMVFLSAFVNAPFTSMGQLYAEGSKIKIEEKFREFIVITNWISSAVLSVTGLATLKFITLYTKGVADYNYIQPLLNVLFLVFNYLRINNVPYGTMINISGKFSLQNKQCILGAISNLVVSVAFIKYLGVCSIVLGSVIGTLVIYEANVFVINKYITKCSIIKINLKLIINCSITILIAILGQKIVTKTQNYGELLIVSIGAIAISIFLFGLVNLALSKKETSNIFRLALNMLAIK